MNTKKNGLTWADVLLSMSGYAKLEVAEVSGKVWYRGYVGELTFDRLRTLAAIGVPGEVEHENGCTRIYIKEAADDE